MFVWDDANIEHLRRHRVTPQEAEEAILLDGVETQIQERAGEQRMLCLGRTSKGRLLTIIYTMRRGLIRVVTGYAMTRHQQRIYFEGD